MKAARDRKSVAKGYRIDGRACDPAQIDAARRLSVGRTLRATAEAMAAEGFLTANRTTLSPAHIRRLLDPETVGRAPKIKVDETQV
jgi:hypothetical protein